MLGGEGDCDPIKYNNHSYEIYAPSKIKELEFDKIFIASVVDHFIDEITQNLKDLDISKEKIDFGTFGKVAKFARLNFIKTLSMRFKENNTKGAVAELGVWRGETARYINEFFKDDIFYLLDTFEGFSEKDISKEIGVAKKANTNDFSDTSLDFVKKQMLHLDKCYFIKGYFPQSATQIPQDEKFKFVNIDVDLYQPILEGLKYFYPRMVKDGVILVHDYFHPYYTGTKKAVDEFCESLNLKALPIGDAFSVMIVKE
ncbi:TylF/MycF/NovP-related O-methyltransferase [Campylobacter sp. US33a]|uniref:TylF/MycF/NovP-related O-methyltransferase n=1 Tax=Campylobacter sp. US33a TaxID=2498120 RepID=UPI001ABA9318|nr:TylF/MycF/NovP-related O-methyltransferase [Campylobacter sp. US33a]